MPELIGPSATLADIVLGLGLVIGIAEALGTVGAFALTLFAAWCIGHRFGVPQLALVGAATVLAAPQLVLDDAGSGLNDVAGIAFFLAAIALVSNAMRPEASPRARRAEMLCGALAG